MREKNNIGEAEEYESKPSKKKYTTLHKIKVFAD